MWTEERLGQLMLIHLWRFEMATVANVLLDFGHQIAITIRDDATWSVTGDPKGVLDLDGGPWKVTPPTGTELIGGGLTQVVLLGWTLASMPVGKTEEGAAYLFPETANTVGSFKVTQAF
jgi:hypothetical protein